MPGGAAAVSRAAAAPLDAAEIDAFRASARRFVEREIAPHVAAWDEAETFPRELYAQGRRGRPDRPRLSRGIRRHAGADAAAPGRHRGSRARRQRRPDGEPVLALDRPAADRRPRQRGAASGASSPTCSPAGRSPRSPSPSPAAAPTSPGSPAAPAATATHWVIDGEKTFITSGVRADWITRRGAHRRQGRRRHLAASPCPAMRPASSARRWPRWAGGAATPRSCASPAAACRPTT